MEKELESKIYYIEDYVSKENMEEHIKEYVKNLKEKYPQAIITREFYKEQNILIRATEVKHQKEYKKIDKEKEIDDWYIRQKGGR